MKFSQIAYLSSFLLAASAELVIKKPYGSTVWDFNSKENPVKWTHTDETGSKELHLFYTAGQDPSQYRGKPVATETVSDVTKDSFKFDLTKLDKSQFPPEEALYFLRFGDKDGSYSHLFTIKGGEGDKVAAGASSGSDSGSNAGNAAAAAGAAAAGAAGAAGNAANNAANAASNAANNAADAAGNAANAAGNAANNAANAAGNAANNAANAAGNAANNAANAAGNAANNAANGVSNTINAGNSTATTGQANVNPVVQGNSVATNKPNSSGAMKTATTSFAAIALAVAAFLF